MRSQEARNAKWDSTPRWPICFPVRYGSCPVISQPLGRTEGLRIVDASIRPSRKDRSDAAFLACCDRDVVVGIVAEVGYDIRVGGEPVQNLHKKGAPFYNALRPLWRAKLQFARHRIAIKWMKRTTK